MAANEFELMRNVTVGQYIPTGSIVHRLDPRAKLIASVLLMFAISFSRALIPVGLVFASILVIARISRIPYSYILRGILLGLPLLTMVFLLQFIFNGRTEPAGHIYFEWEWFRITHRSLQSIALGLTRIMCFIFVTSLVTMTSTITELTHGMESLLKPFRRFGVPSHELALVNMIALRFVPTLAEEMERVMKAQASRCADIGGRRFWRPDRAARAYLPLLVPLFLNALRRAEELVLAMEARCYMGGEGRTKFVQFKARPLDHAIVIAALALFVLVAFTPWPSITQILAAFGLTGL
jgi:energy-coupling factor transport system permease protein